MGQMTTDEVNVGLFDELKKAQQEIETLRKWQRDMVAKMAEDHDLAGYREMGEKLAARDEEIESLQDKLNEIKHWCAAYPLDIFPEPDFKKARELLEAGGMTIDAISASNMRHITTGIQKIIDGGGDEESIQGLDG